jgi:hypothetical protein
MKEYLSVFAIIYRILTKLKWGVNGKVKYFPENEYIEDFNPTSAHADNWLLQT